jgi:hypothetical protein
MLKIKQYMIEFEAKCFQYDFFCRVRMYIFQYWSLTSFRVAIDDSQHVEILEGEW